MIQRLLTTSFLLVFFLLSIRAQIVTSDPAFPSADQEVTITFDATEGTGGLADCNCDVYIHTGLITENSTNPSDWQYVPTEWGVANAAWRLTPVPGQDNKYTFTYGPSIREYFGAPEGETIERLAFVFRNGDGSLEGKATGGADIFLDVQQNSGELASTLISPDVNNLELALGETIQVSGSASEAARLSIVDNGVELTTVEDATELDYDLTVVDAGMHEVLFIASNETQADTSRFTYNASLRVDLLAPTEGVVQIFPGGSVDVNVEAFIDADISILINDTFEEGNGGASSDYSTTLDFGVPGNYTVTIEAEYQGEVVKNGFVVIVNAGPPVMDPPVDRRDGITFLSDTEVYLQLNAPGKNNVVVIGDFSEWLPRAEYLMNKGTDGGTFWIEIGGLTPGEKYGFQYLVDGDLKIADPLSTVVLDRWNDPFISDEVYPDLPDYPLGLTDGIVSLLEPGAESYEWQVNDFEAPAKGDLVIYELLLRDFLETHDYKTLIDTLDYLDRLGITAIELMPISEFEGNISWGYNPSFHMALDKYYGTINQFKQFVDECHARGIAVIVDVVYNHAFSQSSLAQLYWDPALFRPTPDNPWLNPEARHPFNVGYDFNHESEHTVRYVDQVMTYWLEEFRLDGFRFDLSKGFTQKFTTDVGAWNAYDGPRIAIIKHYTDVCWAVNPDAYMIMEHFADNAEESELEAYGNGMMFWAGAGLHDQYLEAAMGYSGNFNGAPASSRGWTGPNLIAYMESHDEERMMYKNEQFANSNGDYDIKDIIIGLQRVELASTFFYPIPGPKMLWQFGELGYGFSINYCGDGSINGGCRTDPKPIRWDYLESQNRQRVYNVKKALIELKTTYDVFKTDDFQLYTFDPEKRIHLNGDDMDVAIIGNFDVIPRDVTDPFQHDGWWYEYFTGDSINVTNPAEGIGLAPGEYRLYTTVRLDEPPGGFITDTREQLTEEFGLKLLPNPTVGDFQIQYELPEAGKVRIDVLDQLGRPVTTLLDAFQGSGAQQWSGQVRLPAGMYFLRLRANNSVQVDRLIIN